MDTTVICSVGALDVAELLAFPHLIAGGHYVLLAEAGACAARAEPPTVAPVARGSASRRATRRRRQLRLRREWRETAAAAPAPAA
jgi:hypothetical protein